MAAAAQIAGEHFADFHPVSVRRVAYFTTEYTLQKGFGSRGEFRFNRTGRSRCNQRFEPEGEVVHDSSFDRYQSEARAPYIQRATNSGVRP
jgi:hypothetical protein